MRPPRPVRVAVLVAAVACLGLTMCAHSRGPSSSGAQDTTQQAAYAPQAAPSHDGRAQPKTASIPADAERAAPPDYYFSATKAPGPIYPQPQQQPPPQQQAR
jgi:hypothetical protein